MTAIEVTADAQRPAERWFMPICPGKPEGDSEGAFRARQAIEWIDEWKTSRLRVALALSEEKADG